MYTHACAGMHNGHNSVIAHGLQTVEVPGKGKVSLGDLTSTDMVLLYLKPLTGQLKLDYVQVSSRLAG